MNTVIAIVEESGLVVSERKALDLQLEYMDDIYVLEAVERLCFGRSTEEVVVLKDGAFTLCVLKDWTMKIRMSDADGVVGVFTPSDMLLENVDNPDVVAAVTRLVAGSSKEEKVATGQGWFTLTAVA